MKLKPYSVENIGGWYKRSDNYRILTEFVESDIKCAEVLEYVQKSAKICQTSLLASIKHYGIHNVHVITRGENVYLVKD